MNNKMFAHRPGSPPSACTHRPETADAPQLGPHAPIPVARAYLQHDECPDMRQPNTCDGRSLCMHRTVCSIAACESNNCCQNLCHRTLACEEANQALAALHVPALDKGHNLRLNLGVHYWQCQECHEVPTHYAMPTNNPTSHIYGVQACYPSEPLGPLTTYSMTSLPPGHMLIRPCLFALPCHSLALGTSQSKRMLCLQRLPLYPLQTA